MVQESDVSDEVAILLLAVLTPELEDVEILSALQFLPLFLLLNFAASSDKKSGCGPGKLVLGWGAFGASDGALVTFAGPEVFRNVLLFNWSASDVGSGGGGGAVFEIGAVPLLLLLLLIAVPLRGGSGGAGGGHGALTGGNPFVAGCGCCCCCNCPFVGGAKPLTFVGCWV